MRFKKSLLTAVARLVLGLALFAQINMAAYACTPPQLPQVQSGMEGMPCHLQGSDTAPKLCKQYCMSAQQTVDQFNPAVLTPSELPAVLTVVFAEPPAIQAIQVAALSAVDPPPGSPVEILFSRFLS